MVAHEAPLSMGILQARILEWVAMPSSRGSSNPGTEPRSPTLQADSLPAELPRTARQFILQVKAHLHQLVSICFSHSLGLSKFTCLLIILFSGNGE